MSIKYVLMPYSGLKTAFERLSVCGYLILRALTDLLGVNKYLIKNYLSACIGLFNI